MMQRSAPKHVFKNIHKTSICDLCPHDLSRPPLCSVPPSVSLSLTFFSLLLPLSPSLSLTVPPPCLSCFLLSPPPSLSLLTLPLPLALPLALSPSSLFPSLSLPPLSSPLCLSVFLLYFPTSLSLLSPLPQDHIWHRCKMPWRALHRLKDRCCIYERRVGSRSVPVRARIGSTSGVLVCARKAWQIRPGLFSPRAAVTCLTNAPTPVMPLR